MPLRVSRGIGCVTVVDADGQPLEKMPKYGKYDFPENAELQRKAGSDWLKDTKGKLRKVRG